MHYQAVSEELEWDGIWYQEIYDNKKLQHR